MQKIRARILAADDGTVFVAYDSAEIADSATIRQELKRFYKSGVIRRITRGIYEKLDEFMCNPSVLKDYIHLKKQ